MKMPSGCREIDLSDESFLLKDENIKYIAYRGNHRNSGEKFEYLVFLKNGHRFITWEYTHRAHSGVRVEINEPESSWII